jgi:predicted lipase
MADEESYITKVLPQSIKFYLPRTEGYMDVVKEIVSKYDSISLIEFDGYFEGKFEPVKYTRLEVHTAKVEERQVIEYANKIRNRLRQNSLALELNDKLILVIKH